MYAIRSYYDLADQDVPRLDAGADLHDPALVEVAKRALRLVRDVAGDLLAAELGVSGHALELFDVDRGEGVLLEDPLGDDDGVLEVVSYNFV